jgi:integrase
MADIKKRGDSWRVRVRRVGYPTKTGTFDTKAEAEKWAGVIESEMTRGVFVDRTLAEKTTFAEVIESYCHNELPTHKGGVTEDIRLRAFLRDQAELVGRRMATLKPEDFENFRDRRLKKVAPGTVKRELNLLHAIIENSRRRLGLVENPVSPVRRPTVRDARDVRLAPGDEERLFAAIDAESRNPWLKPSIILAVETAMRKGELLALRWENIDLDNRVAFLPDTKTGKARKVPLSSRAIATLRALPRSLNGRVLATTSEGLKCAFERARKRAGMEHFNFHDLRHEAASRLFERGWNVMEVAAVTGHADLQSLKRYTNLRAEDLAKKLG